MKIQLKKIRYYVQNKCIWSSIDETTDTTTCKYVENVISILNATERSMVFILYSEELKKCNYFTICKLFDRSMNSLWPNGIHHNKVLLFLSDAALYTVKTGETIQLFYSKVLSQKPYRILKYI